MSSSLIVGKKNPLGHVTLPRRGAGSFFCFLNFVINILHKCFSLPAMRLELIPPYGEGILSPQCLPFHHAGNTPVKRRFFYFNSLSGQGQESECMQKNINGVCQDLLRIISETYHPKTGFPENISLLLKAFQVFYLKMI